MKRVLDQRVAQRRANKAAYRASLGALPGLDFMPDDPRGEANNWLTCLSLEPKSFGASREALRLHLEAHDIDARPVWKPMHLQPVFSHCPAYGGAVAADLFERGLCLPSGSNLSQADHARVCAAVLDLVRA